MTPKRETAEKIAQEAERAMGKGNLSDDFLEPLAAWRKSKGEI